MKKTLKTKMASYCPPRVLQTARVMLEVDLLQGASAIRSIQATGHETEDVQTFENTAWD